MFQKIESCCLVVIALSLSVDCNPLKSLYEDMFYIKVSFGIMVSHETASVRDMPFSLHHCIQVFSFSRN